MKAYFIAVLLASTLAISQKSTDDALTRDEEARAIERASVRRVARALDSNLAHSGDVDNSAAMSALKGRTPSHEDAHLKYGDNATSEPFLQRALMRINHPLFPYPKNDAPQRPNL